MKKRIIQITCMLLIGLNTQYVSAQYVAQSAVYNTNVPGKVEFRDTPSWAGLFKSSHQEGNKDFRSFENSMAAICSVVTDVPVMNPPMGFNVKPYVSLFYAHQKYVIDPIPLMDVTFCDYPFYTLNGKHKMEQSSHWSSSIIVFENDAQWLLDENSDRQNNCDSVGIPYFYDRPEMHTDKNGDWIIKPQKLIAEIHVIKKKDVPIYAPVTQREYLDFKLKVTQMNLASLKRDLAYTKKNSAKHPEDQELKDDVGYAEKNITSTVKAVREYQQALSSWTDNTLNEPAYISYTFRHKNGSAIDLVASDFPKAVELVRLNKNYFDKSLSPGTPQLIMIGANYDLSATPNMKYEVKKWFDEINYSKLQSMIR